MKDQTTRIKQELKLHLDVSDADAQVCYAQLNESERAEVLRWADLLAEGKSIDVEGQAVPVDRPMATEKIRAVYRGRQSRGEEEKILSAMQEHLAFSAEEARMRFTMLSPEERLDILNVVQLTTGGFVQTVDGQPGVKIETDAETAAGAVLRIWNRCQARIAKSFEAPAVLA